MYLDTPDVLTNPYVPPLKNESYPLFGNRDATYRQVGILTDNDGKILPLMAKPVDSGRDLWNYYTMSDQQNTIKLPIIKNGKSGTDEYGVSQVNNNDKVVVKGYDKSFKVSTYDNDPLFRYNSRVL
jgi:hypothetical protein